jgi:hypothetical protein
MIPESLASTSTHRWGREAVFVHEVEGFWLLRMDPPFNDSRDTGNHFVIAFWSGGQWDGWCCAPNVLDGSNSMVNADVPKHILDLFRNLLLLL